MRGVYFAPADHSFRDCLRERLGTWIELARRFFAEEMSAAGHLDDAGYGKTFCYETGADGRWGVVYLIGEHAAAWYQSPEGYPGSAAFDEMYRRLPAAFHRDNVVVNRLARRNDDRKHACQHYPGTRLSRKKKRVGLDNAPLQAEGCTRPTRERQLE